MLTNVVESQNRLHELDRVILTNYASNSYLRKPHSFLRWAGSKRFLLKHIVNVLPSRYNVYFEPFLGSAALFFFLQPQYAVLSDKCRDLINTYKTIIENVNKIIEELQALKGDRDSYYYIRENRSSCPIKFAAEFIYLNKHCWNGLYRVNASGKFNVPYGRFSTPPKIEADNLRQCSTLLCNNNISINSVDFEECVQNARRGDLVFFDPPYVTGHSNNGFVAYNEKIFSWEDQERLARVSRTLVEKGVNVIICNSDHNAIRELYSGFKFYTFERASTLAAKKLNRRLVSELLIYAHSD